MKHYQPCTQMHENQSNRNSKGMSIQSQVRGVDQSETLYGMETGALVARSQTSDTIIYNSSCVCLISLIAIAHGSDELCRPF
jgi:hypothetical protein